MLRHIGVLQEVYYYEHGYILERYGLEGSLISCNGGHDIFYIFEDYVTGTRCSLLEDQQIYFYSLDVTYKITKKKTDCCILVCCEPDKYELRT